MLPIETPHGERNMKTFLAAAVMSLALVGAVAPEANARGCIKGALVGGIAGHMAGHGVAGAAAGCAVGHHYANKRSVQDTNTTATPSDGTTTTR